MLQRTQLPIRKTLLTGLVALMLLINPVSVYGGSSELSDNLNISSPVSGTRLTAGQSYDITFDSSLDDIAYIEISYSTDRGATFSRIPGTPVARTVPNSDIIYYSLTWEVPSVQSDSCQLRFDYGCTVWQNGQSSIKAKFQFSDPYFKIVKKAANSPAAPWGLTAGALIPPSEDNSQYSVPLSWAVCQGYEGKIWVERQSPGETFWTCFPPLPATGTWHTDMYANPGRTYYYRIKAEYTGFDPLYSNTITVTIPSAADPDGDTTEPGEEGPTAPSDFLVEAVSSTEVRLSWIFCPGYDGFLYVERMDSASGVWETVSQPLTSNTASWSQWDLEPGTAYTYRVRAEYEGFPVVYTEPIIVTLPGSNTPGEGIILKYTVGQKGYYINDALQYMDVAPVVIDDRMRLPIRYVVEPLGGTVSWDGHNMITIECNGHTIQLWANDSMASVDGVMRPIDPGNPNVTLMVVDNRTMVPLRFVSECLDCRVEWDVNSQTASISYPS